MLVWVTAYYYGVFTFCLYTLVTSLHRINQMSKLTTQEMIAIAQETKKAKAALAFRISGMATSLTERERKTVLMNFKASVEEKARYQALADHLGLSLSAIIRTILNRACEDVELTNSR